MYDTCGEYNNHVAKKSLYIENLQHCYFLATGLFCSPQAVLAVTRADVLTSADHDYGQ